MLSSVAIIAGISIAPLVNGYVIDSALRWKWVSLLVLCESYFLTVSQQCFWLVTIFTAFGTIATILFVPETVYHRDAAYETDAGASAAEAAKVNQALDVVEHHQTAEEEKATDVDHAENVLQAHHIHHNYLPAKTFVQELAPWSGYVNPVSFWKVFLRPFPMALSPVVFCKLTLCAVEYFQLITWEIGGFWIYGVTTAWIVTLSVSSSIIFGSPPLLFDSKQTGLMSVGPFIASILGTIVTAPLLDYFAIRLARRNKGVFEPEFRLVLLAPMLVICFAGFIGWYAMLKTGVQGWVGPEFM